MLRATNCFIDCGLVCLASSTRESVHRPSLVAFRHALIPGCRCSLHHICCIFMIYSQELQRRNNQAIVSVPLPISDKVVPPVHCWVYRRYHDRTSSWASCEHSKNHWVKQHQKLWLTYVYASIYIYTHTYCVYLYLSIYLISIYLSIYLSLCVF